MSDTPRTDEAIEKWGKSNVFEGFVRDLERLLDLREKQLIECQSQLITRNAELATALAHIPESFVVRLEQCARHMGQPILMTASYYPPIRTVCPNCQHETSSPTPPNGNIE